MPTLPPRPCLGPGCRKLVASPDNRCKDCKTKRNRQRDAGRGDDKTFYKSPAWRRVRSERLRLNPICQACKREAATIADHIIPRHERPDLELEMSNTQSMCFDCHNIKTVAEDGGFGNRRRARGRAHVN